MRRTLYVFLALAFLGFHGLATLQRGAEPRPVLRLRDATRVPFVGMMGDAFDARLVFVGELHDQAAHHAAQLQVIRAFHEADRPVAVAMEMFRAESQPALDRWVAGEMSREEFLSVYYDNWNFPWVYYAGILEYVREHAIPLVGLNIPEALVQQVAREGFRSLSPTQVGALPTVRCEVDRTYEEFIRRALGMHGRSNRTFVNFCEAQMLWDTAMAVHLLDYLDRGPAASVVVLAGSGHAWKRGIPEQVARRNPELTRVVVVPEIPGRLEVATASPDDADYLWLGLTSR